MNEKIYIDGRVFKIVDETYEVLNVKNQEGDYTKKAVVRAVETAPLCCKEDVYELFLNLPYKTPPSKAYGFVREFSSYDLSYLYIKAKVGCVVGHLKKTGQWDGYSEDKHIYVNAYERDNICVVAEYNCNMNVWDYVPEKITVFAFDPATSQIISIQDFSNLRFSSSREDNKINYTFSMRFHRNSDMDNIVELTETVIRSAIDELFGEIWQTSCSSVQNLTKAEKSIIEINFYQK